MKRALLIIAAGLLSVTSTVAQAGQWYVRGDAGYGWSRDGEIKDKGDCNAGSAAVGCDKLDGNYGGGFAVGIGAGKQILPWLRADATLSYRGGHSLEIDGEELVSQDLQTWTGMANAYVDVRGLTDVKMGVFHPYAGVGIGLSHHKLDNLHGANGGISPGGTSNDFTWSVTAGTGIMVIKDKLMFDIAYRYIDMGKAETDGGIGNVGGTTVAVDAIEAEVRMHEITAGLRYMF